MLSINKKIAINSEGIKTRDVPAPVTSTKHAPRANNKSGSIKNTITRSVKSGGKLTLAELTSAYLLVNSTYHNTGVSVHKGDGHILFSVTSGSLGFKKSKRSTPYAAQRCGERVAEWLGVHCAGVEKGNALHANALHANALHANALHANNVIPSVNAEKTVRVTQDIINSEGIKNIRGVKTMNTGRTTQAKSNAVRSLNTWKVYFNGIGTGKFSVLRGLTKGGVKLTELIDITAVPHNGCKPPLPRRL